MDNRPIGVYDSGFGGLTVLSELVSAFPHEDFIYIGDTLRVPYGNKSTQEVLAYSSQVAQWLANQDVKAIVVACNTSSCIALSQLRASIPLQFFGMIDAGVACVTHFQDLTGVDIHKLGIIGTKNTIQSRAHENSLRTAGFLGEILPVACPLFVPILEEGVLDSHIWNSVLNYYLSPLRDAGVTELLLGCTHYPILAEYLTEYFEGKAQILDPNFMLTQEVKRWLRESATSTSDSASGKVLLYVTGSVDSFNSFYHRFFDIRINSIEMIDLGEAH